MKNVNKEKTGKFKTSYSYSRRLPQLTLMCIAFHTFLLCKYILYTYIIIHLSMLTNLLLIQTFQPPLPLYPKCVTASLANLASSPGPGIISDYYL